MTEEQKKELHHYIATQCLAVSINARNRLVYHYDQMEKVGEFIYNLEEKRIAELEEKLKQAEENCINKTLVEKWKHNGENIIQECKDIEGANAFYEHQLTKAKEIIKKLVEAIHIWDCKNLEQVEAEAEQFLSEVEE